MMINSNLESYYNNMSILNKMQSERITDSRKFIISQYSIDKQKTSTDVYKIKINNNNGSDNIQSKKLKKFPKNKSSDTQMS